MSRPTQPTSEQAAAQRQARAEAAGRCLRSPDGTLLLQWLEESWGRRLPGATPEQMHANAGAWEVIAKLRRLREFDP